MFLTLCIICGIFSRYSFYVIYLDFITFPFVLLKYLVMCALTLPYFL